MSTPQRVNKLKAAMQGMQVGDEAETVSQVVTLPREPRKYPVVPSRQNKRVLSAYLGAEAVKQFHVLAAERDLSVQALLEEALNDLFRKYGKSAIA